MLLEWILALEALALLVLGIMWLISKMTAKQDMTDTLWVFCSTVWREFFYPPATMPIDGARGGVSSGGRGSGRGSSAPSAEDEFYGRVKKSADGRVDKSDLTILVVANAATDAVVGRDGDGLRLNVTGEAGDSRSNKALIELVAQALEVRPYQVTLTKGHYQARKAVQIQGVSPSELREKLSLLGEVD